MNYHNKYKIGKNNKERRNEKGNSDESPIIKNMTGMIENYVNSGKLDTLETYLNEISKANLNRLSRTKAIFVYEVIVKYYTKIIKQKKELDQKDKIEILIDAGKLFYINSKEKNAFLRNTAKVLEKIVSEQDNKKIKRWIEGLYLVGLKIQPKVIKR